eukprot:TRINITY_DN5210_c0_g1_i1.p1 TRINITY_DN5210_c0_g1~~TRINITY_DN5210_c0_g1_i1.p1  ORF type:complete len:805 (+),score=138.69 TRINITY_DN5210_c0_g1_i1:124-2538(+)
MARVVESSGKPPEERDVSDLVRIMTGEMLTYDYLIHASSGAEIQAMQMIANKHRAKLNGCLLLPISILYFFVFVICVFSHLDVTNVYLIENELRGFADGLFEEVDDIDTLWDTISGDGNFIDSLFIQEERWGDGIPKPASNSSDKWGMWGRVGLYNQIQGAIRFEQSRKSTNSFGKKPSCDNDDMCDFLCLSNVGFQAVGCPVPGKSKGDPKCPSLESIRAECGLRRRLNASEQAGVEIEQTKKKRRLSLMSPPVSVVVPQCAADSDDVFRFYVYPSEPKSEWTKRLGYFQNRAWLDKDTTFFQIRLYLLNAEFGQPNMEQLTLNFHMAQGGNIYYTRDVQATFFRIFPGNATMAADGIWFLLLVFSSIVQLVVLCRVFRGKRMRAYLADGRTLLEILALVLGWVVVYQFSRVFMTKRNISGAVEDMRKHGWDLGDLQQSSVDKMFKEAGLAAAQMQFLANMFSNYTLIIMFRFFVNFGAQPMLAIITRTLSHLVVDLTHFLVVFVPSFLVYVASGTLMFGRRMECFATFGASLGCSFRMAQEGEYEWAEFKKEYYWPSAIWVWTFILFINILFINLVLAIILDVYNEVRAAEKTNEPIWETLNQFWHRLIHMRSWTRESRIDEKLKEPGHEDVVTKEQFEAYFPGMPKYQNDILFRDGNQAMAIEAEKNLDANNLLKLCRSMMEDIGTINGSLRTIVDEESKDSLQSWVVPKKEKTEPASQEPENFMTTPVTTKGNKKARLTPLEQANPFDVDSMQWAPEWLREVGGMLKTQRQWLAHATWQLDQLQWNMQNAHVSKLQKGGD